MLKFAAAPLAALLLLGLLASGAPSALCQDVLTYHCNNANLQEIYNSEQAPNHRDQFGAGNKFITPVIIDGNVYVGTTTGVGVFGLLPSPEEGTKTPK
ncbi:MAG: hypothetical protein ABSF59_07095 [Candidatus Sulfotelmatobacter sp.]